MTATRSRLSFRLASALAALVVACLGFVAASSAQAAGTVNGVIAYTAGDIYTVNPNGTNKTRITNTKLIETEPEYSPDGTRIAFVGFPSLKPDEIYVVGADGRNQTKLTSAGGQISRPTWTADGSRILFITDRDDDFNGDEIYSIAPDGSGETLLASDARTQDIGTDLSTAGNKITYSNSDGEITVMNLDGSDKQVLAPDPGDDTGPELSPDASTIAFTSERGAGELTGVFSMTVAGASVTELESGGASVAGYSPDGTKILYTGAQGARSAAKVMNADGTSSVQVSGDRFSFPEEFSPNSQSVSLSEILPRGGEDPKFSLLTTPADGSKLTRLTKGQDGAEYGDWQPLSAPAPAPALKLKAKAVKPRGGAPTVQVTCSNECDLILKSQGRVGGVDYKSRTEGTTPGRFAETVQALGNKSLKLLAGKRGRVRVTVSATDDFGQRAKKVVEVELVR